MECPYCGYQWSPRIPDPVACPRCKRRLDQLPEKHREPVDRIAPRTVFVVTGSRPGPDGARSIVLDGLVPVETDRGTVYLMSVEDFVLDRMRAAKRSGSAADREQAVEMVARLGKGTDWGYLRQKCRKDRLEDMLKEIQEDAANEGE